MIECRRDGITSGNEGVICLGNLLEDRIAAISSSDEGHVLAEQLIKLWRSAWNQRRRPSESPNAIPFCGYRRFGPETWHEELYASWHTHYQRQVTFGTGLGGRKRYGSCSFTADFYDPWANIVWELDGASHSRRSQKNSDARKTAFFRDKGIRVCRTKVEWVEKRAIWLLGEALYLISCHRRGDQTRAMTDDEKAGAKPLLSLLSTTSIFPQSPPDSPHWMRALRAT